MWGIEDVGVHLVLTGLSTAGFLTGGFIAPVVLTYAATYVCTLDPLILLGAQCSSSWSSGVFRGEGELHMRSRGVYVRVL